MHDLVNVTLLLDSSEKTTRLVRNVTIGSKGVMVVRSVTAYWDYDNVKTGVNDTVSVAGGDTLVLSEGFWSFDKIVEKIEPLNVELRLLDESYKCVIKSKSGDLSLGNFAPLLGFPAGTVTPHGVTKVSPLPVDMYLGLEYVDIGCSLAESVRNVDTTGNPSKVIVSVPVTTDGPPKGTVTRALNIERSVPISNGVISHVTLAQRGNNESSYSGKFLLDVCFMNQ